MNPRSGGDVTHAEDILLERLKILVDRLHWSYGVIWTLNPRTRALQWTRGYFQANPQVGTVSSPPPSNWDAQLFYTTYKSCFFAPGNGAVGRASVDGRRFWLTGDSVCQNAGTMEQSQFLRCAKINTMMCIPCINSVLEIGTRNHVRENLQLMDQIHEVLSNDLLGMLPQHHLTSEHACSQADLLSRVDSHLGFHQDAGANNLLALQQPSTEMMSPSISEISLRLSEDLNQPFQSEFNLSDQVWRSAMSSNLSLNSDIFMHDQNDAHLDPDIDKIGKESLSTLHSYGGTHPSFLMPTLPAPSNSAQAEVDFHINRQVNQRSIAKSASHGLMISQGDQYRPWSGAATSSSVSSQGDSSARLSVSPEPQQPQIHLNPLPTSQNSTLDRTSSSGTLRSQFYQNLRRTTSCGDQYEIQKAFSLFEAQEMQEHWRQQAGLQPHLAVAQTATMNDKAWQYDPVSLQKTTDATPNLLKRSSNASLVNQVSKVAGVLLRRKSLSALEVLKVVDTYHQEIENKSLDQDQNTEEEPLRLTTTVAQNNTPNLRGRRRWGTEQASSSRGPGPVHAGHDEAAVNHMMAERRRRMKQKENFTALRRLVPIISKADKASTLIDAITYLKDLQNKIQEMKAGKEDINQRCETLEIKCRELEDRNQELVAMLSSNQQSSSNQLDALKSSQLQSFSPSELKPSDAQDNPTYPISSDYHM